MATDVAFSSRYGPTAVVAGASEGLGEAFARELAERGFSLVLMARRQEPLERLATELRSLHGAEIRVVPVDLAAPADTLAKVLTDAVAGLDVGLAIYNAAYSCIGEFHQQPLEDQVRTVEVNCRGPVVFAHLYGRMMAERGSGGLLLMSSLAGTQGSALLASYAASKAFNTVLAEGLWQELAPRGVDVLACRAGATRTPNYVSSQPVGGGATMEPRAVVVDALAALGHGPTMVPGWRNRFGAWVMGSVLPRNTAVRLMSRITRSMYGRTLPPKS